MCVTETVLLCSFLISHGNDSKPHHTASRPLSRTDPSSRSSHPQPWLSPAVLARLFITMARDAKKNSCKKKEFTLGHGFRYSNPSIMWGDILHTSLGRQRGRLWVLWALCFFSFYSIRGSSIGDGAASFSPPVSPHWKHFHRHSERSLNGLIGSSQFNQVINQD